MKNRFNLRFLMQFRAIILVAFVASFTSCSDDSESPTPSIETTSNVFVLNEGSFGAQDGTISTFSPENLAVQNKVYNTANQVSIGGLINSTMLHENRLYAVTNLADKVEILDAGTFEHINAISDQLIIPREVVIANGKLYISNWGEYDENWQNPDSYLLVVDLSTNSIIKKIDLKNGAEYMLLFGNELFVAHGQDSKISVIDTNSDEITDEITVSANPKRMILDNNGSIWVISGSQKLDKIDISSKSITKTITISTENEYPMSGFLSLNKEGNKAYFLAGESWPSTVTNLYELDLSVNSPTPNVLISKENMNSFGIDPTDGTIYVGIAPDYSSNGTVVRFLSDGTELDNFTAGIAPKFFIFE